MLRSYITNYIALKIMLGLDEIFVMLSLFSNLIKLSKDK
jgi:hypothetical protein